ncbi:MAG: butyrate kinase [Bacteroidales bacterium]|nr:butyrate kinase [Bacteroidota bacterium]MBL6950234.1 butyrate kinase [Bacteroidales bacterium]
MTFNILVVNPKDKMTQIAVFEDFTLLYINNRRHSAEELARYPSVYDQVDYRTDIVFKELENNHFDTSNVKVVISRGGLIKPVHSGVFKVSDKLKHDLRNSPIGLDVINIGGLVADAVAARIEGARALIADPAVVDEMQDVARITGVPGIERKSIFHALNQKAVAKLYAESLKKDYNELNLIVAHMGNGTTVGAHCKGNVIDVNQGFEGDGPFSMIRCGSLPLGEVVSMCTDGEKTKEEAFALLTHKGGINAHLGTTNITEIENRIKNGDKKAALVFEAMAYQVSKSIGEMFVALKGEVDAILLTGDLAHSEFVVNSIRDHVDKLGQVIVFAGDNETQAMASNALRVIKGEIEVSEYK